MTYFAATNWNGLVSVKLTANSLSLACSEALDSYVQEGFKNGQDDIERNLTCTVWQIKNELWGKSRYNKVLSKYATYETSVKGIEIWSVNKA